MSDVTFSLCAQSSVPDLSPENWSDKLLFFFFLNEAASGAVSSSVCTQEFTHQVAFSAEDCSVDSESESVKLLGIKLDN